VILMHLYCYVRALDALNQKGACQPALDTDMRKTLKLICAQIQEVVTGSRGCSTREGRQSVVVAGPRERSPCERSEGDRRSLGGAVSQSVVGSTRSRREYSGGGGGVEVEEGGQMRRWSRGRGGGSGMQGSPATQ
jgi:hypothetical protein